MSMSAAGIVLIAPGNRVLYMLRDDGGGWGIPGGKVEQGETFIQAAVRETFEETGLQIDPETLRAVSVQQNADGFEFAAFAARVPLEFIPRLTEHTAAVWATPAEAPAPQFMNNAEIVALATGVAVGDRAEVDVNGWITYPDNPISKEGVFPYLGKTLIAAGFEGLDPDAPYMVYRPGTELSRQETIDSFKLVPWIIEHTHMGEGATDTDNVGIGGIVGEQVYYRDGVLYGNLKVFGDSQKQAIYKNGLKELSIGYTAQFDKSPGVWRGQAYDFVQRGIMGNHLASVQEGRSGPDIRVQDNSEVPMDEETKARLEKLEQGHQEILAAIRELVATKKEVEGEDEDDAKKPEEETKAADEDDADKAKTADSDEEIEKKAEAAVADALPRALAALRRRDALAGRAAKHIGVFDHADMTEAQVAKYAAGKLGVSLSTPDTLRAYLDGLDKAAGAAAPARVADSAVTGTLPAFLQKQLEA